MRKLFNTKPVKVTPASRAVPLDLISANSSEQDSQAPQPHRRDVQDEQQDLMRMIGYLTATLSEDWAVVLDVCERASATEANAKEAAKALRREFKYGEAPQQLSAARLWAIMLRNSSELFVYQCAKSKFLDTLEDVVSSQRTSPVVRDRLLDVLAAAAYASSGTSHQNESSFRLLWRKVKPVGKPDEGVPFDPNDVMFNPPSPRRSTATALPPGYQPPVHPQSLQGAPPPNTQPQAPARPLKSPRAQAPQQPNQSVREAGQVKRVIPPDEDIRRLFQECRFAQGNAQLLSEALEFASPEDLRKKDIIKEWYSKCIASQELIAAQIPWATAGADRSRTILEAQQQQQRTKRPNGLGAPNVLNKQGSGEESLVELTPEEKLLGSLLKANEALTSVLRVYDLKEMGRPASPPITCERNANPNGLPSQPTGVNGMPRRVSEEDDDGEGPAEYPAKFAVHDSSSEGGASRLEGERLVELERQLLATLAAQAERDRRLAQLADELALKNALLERAEANAAEATKRAGLELREHADRLLAQTSLMEQKNAELVNMQAKLDELLLSRDQHVGSLEQAQSAPQRATYRTSDAGEQSRRASEQIGHHETELVKVHAARQSELEERFADSDNGWTKNNTEGDASPTLTLASLVNTDDDLITRGIVERIRALEAEVAMLRWSEKGSEAMMNLNEG